MFSIQGFLYYVSISIFKYFVFDWNFQMENILKYL